MKIPKDYSEDSGETGQFLDSLSLPLECLIYIGIAALIHLFFSSM